MYVKLFSVKPWSSFYMSGSSQPQKWQWLASCSAFRCPGVRLGAGRQMPDYAKDLAKFDQLTEGWGTQQSARDSNFNNLLPDFLKIFVGFLLGFFFLGHLFFIHIFTLDVPGCTFCIAIARMLFRITVKWDKHRALEALMSSAAHCKHGNDGKICLLLASRLLCVNSLPKEKNI